jgi:hypothetical protein
LVASALLVATTWYVPGVPGAVYRPAALTLPPEGDPSSTDHLTDVSAAPVTEASNAAATPEETLTDSGVTSTTTPWRAASPVGAVVPEQAVSETSVSAARKELRTMLMAGLSGFTEPRTTTRRTGHLPSPDRGA